MQSLQKGTRSAQVKDVSSCFFPQSNGHATPRLGAAAQKKNQQQNWNRNSQQPQQNVTSSRRLFRSIDYFHFCISFRTISHLPATLRLRDSARDSRLSSRVDQ